MASREIQNDSALAEVLSKMVDDGVRAATESPKPLFLNARLNIIARMGQKGLGLVPAPRGEIFERIKEIASGEQSQ